MGRSRSFRRKLTHYPRLMIGTIDISTRKYLMTNDRVFAMSFAGVYPHYVAKAEKKSGLARKPTT
jgi:hypothetical protein